jgi:hypothetical protein
MCFFDHRYETLTLPTEESMRAQLKSLFVWLKSNETHRRNYHDLNCEVTIFFSPPLKLGRVVCDRFEEEHVSCCHRTSV